MGKNVWKQNCINCLAKDKMIVVEDDGEDLLEQQSVCSVCDYSVLHKQQWHTVAENYLGDAERKKFIEEYEGDMR